MGEGKAEERTGTSHTHASDDTVQPVRITAAFVEVDTVPLNEANKMKLLRQAFMPLLYAFDGMQVTLSVELTRAKHPDSP